MAHPGRRPVEYVDYIDTVDIPGINTITMYRLVKRVVAATLKFQKNAQFVSFYVVAIFLYATGNSTYDSEPPATTRLPYLLVRGGNSSACDCQPELQPSPTWTMMTRQYDHNFQQPGLECFPMIPS